MIWEVSPAIPAGPFSPTLAQGCQKGPGAAFLCPEAHSPPSPFPAEAGSMVFRTIGFVTLQEFGSRKFLVSFHCSNKVVASISCSCACGKLSPLLASCQKCIHREERLKISKALGFQRKAALHPAPSQQEA